MSDTTKPVQGIEVPPDPLAKRLCEQVILRAEADAEMELLRAEVQRLTCERNAVRELAWRLWAALTKEEE